MVMIFHEGKGIIMSISTFNTLTQNIQLKFNSTSTHITILAIKYMYVVSIKERE